MHCTASILYASPIHRHPSQRVNPVHLILAFFVLRKLPSSWPSSSFNFCFVCTLVRFCTPSYIRVVLAGLTVDEEKKEEMEIRREQGRTGVREKRDKERNKESMKSRGRRGLLQSALLEVREYFKEGRFTKSESLFSPRQYRTCIVEYV